MSIRQETADDIIAEMLGARTEFPFVYLMGEPDTLEVIDPKTKEIIAPRKINIRRVTVKELAHRLEAALERERGNAAKAREALEKMADSAAEIMERVRHKDGLAFNVANYIANIARAALAAPPRNCDVGTVKDQTQRFYRFCKSRSGAAIGGECNPNCPCYDCDDVCQCLLEWMQMPYEEGAAK